VRRSTEDATVLRRRTTTAGAQHILTRSVKKEMLVWLGLMLSVTPSPVLDLETGKGGKR